MNSKLISGVTEFLNTEKELQEVRAPPKQMGDLVGLKGKLQEKSGISQTYRTSPEDYFSLSLFCFSLFFSNAATVR